MKMDFADVKAEVDFAIDKLKAAGHLVLSEPDECDACILAALLRLEALAEWCEIAEFDPPARKAERLRREAKAILDHADALEAEGRQGGADVVTLSQK